MGGSAGLNIRERERRTMRKAALNDGDVERDGDSCVKGWGYIERIVDEK